MIFRLIKLPLLSLVNPNRKTKTTSMENLDHKVTWWTYNATRNVKIRQMKITLLYIRAYIHLTDGRLTARPRLVSKPRDSGVDFSNRSEI